MSTQKQIEQDYIDYLKSRHNTRHTIDNKLGYLNHFFKWLEREGLSVQDCSYGDLLGYVKKVRSEIPGIDYQNRHVHSVRQLYASEVVNGRMTSSPMGNLVIRGRVARLPHDLLTPEQLQKIYDSYLPQTDYQVRNKVMLGLYINQGLIRTEVNQLQVQDIDLVKGRVSIRKNIKLAERTLPLAAHQVLILSDYIGRVRPQLLKQSEYEKGDRLFFTYAHGLTINEAVRKLLLTIRKKHPELKTLKQIRSSVVSQWAKEKPIREAQYMSGHSVIASTQRYKDASMEDLQASLNEFHPMK